MTQELIQLLQSDDSNNIKLGCILARGQGYNDVDIIDSMYVLQFKDWFFNGIGITVRENKLEIRLTDYKISLIQTEHITYNKRKDFTHIIFAIYNYITADTHPDDMKIRVRQKNYNKTKAEYAKAFIDLIIRF